MGLIAVLAVREVKKGCYSVDFQSPYPCSIGLFVNSPAAGDIYQHGSKVEGSKKYRHVKGALQNASMHFLDGKLDS